MIIRITRTVGRQLLTALMLALVVLAVYVLAGRQLAPLVARYDQAISDRLAVMLDMPVALSGLQGQWRGFSPQLSVQQLQLIGNNGAQAPALALHELTLVLDLPRSLLSMGPVLSRVELSSLELVLVEQDNGAWLLDGRDLAGPAITTQQLFDIAARIGQLQLRDARIRFEHRDGSNSVAQNAWLDFNSHRGEHQLQLAAQAPGGEQLQLGARLSGQQLDQLAGEFYLELPNQELASYLNALPRTPLAINVMETGLQLWGQLDAGQLVALDGHVNLPLLALQQPSLPASASSEEVTLRDLALTLNWRRGQDGQWQLWLYDLNLLLGNNRWPPGMFYAHYQGDEQLSFHADTVDAGMATTLLRDLHLLPQRGIDELTVLNPRGVLQQLSGVVAWRDDGLQAFSLRTNMDNMRVSARGAAPAVWGVNGYAELHHSADSRLTRGFAEIDSQDLMLHLPNLFDDIWAYDHVNGRVNFQLDVSDGMWLRVDSSVVSAQSEVLSGRAQFATEFNAPADADWPEITLELMVGTLEADLAFKSRYLPMAPGAPRGAQGILAWVDEAVLGGSGAGSGFLFRGHVHRGAAPASRTMQMFYHIEDGRLAFDADWPALEAVHGHVVVDDRLVDIVVSEGSSLGIGFAATTAAVRGNDVGPGNWLSVSGEGRGSAGQGLQYLAQTPVTAGLGAYFANWHSAGDVDFTLDLAIPLFVRGAEPSISLRLGLDGNHIYIPEYDLDVHDINGELHYENALGLRSEALTASFFDAPVQVSLRAGGAELQGNDSVIEVSGYMPAPQLRQWSMQPAALRELLSTASGGFDYEARLDLPQQRPGQTGRPALHVRSDLQGLMLDYPLPLGKPAAAQRELDMQLIFAADEQELRLRMDELLSLNARLHSGSIERGLLFFSPPADGVPVRRFNNTDPGLEVLGSLPALDVADWFSFLRGSNDSGQPATAALGGWRDILASLAQLDVNVASLALASERLEQVNLQLRPQPDGWRLAVNSEALRANALLPRDVHERIELDIDYIRLGGADVAGEPVLMLSGEEGAGEEIPFDQLETVEYVMPREDPLAAMDPRDLPAMLVRIDEIRLRGADYGRWQFALQPVAQGLELQDLTVHARGLAIGSVAAPAHFSWLYQPGEPGEPAQHYSQLEAEITAEDLGTVLSAYGYAPVLISREARFDTDLHWQGSPAFFSAVGLNGELGLQINDGRFLRGTASAANNALKLISIANFDAVVRRLRFSDDLVRQGLAYDEIRGRVSLNEGIVTIADQLQIIGPSSLFQISGDIDLPNETIDGTLNITLPVSENIPWLSGLAVLNNIINWQVAVGVFLIDRIFGDQVDNLTSAQYTLKGPWEGLEPRLAQAFGGGGSQ